MTPHTSARRLRLALITIQVLFGINYLASKTIVTTIGPAAWAALRTGFAFLVIAAIALAGRRKLPSRRDIFLLGGAAFFGIVLNQGLFLEGLARTTVGRSALICSQIPTFVLLFSILAGQEQMTWRRGLSFLAGVAGVLVLLKADRVTLDTRYLVGDLLTLGNAASYSIYVVISRRLMARNDPLAATAVVFFWGTLGMLLYGGHAAVTTDFGSLTTAHLQAMAFVILGATVVTYFLNLWAVKRVAATRVALYIFLQPVVATTLGLAFGGEELTVRFGVAAALVLSALMIQDSS